MVSCMLRNSQPSHTTICYHAVCWKVFITHFCNQIPLIRQKFLLTTFVLFFFSRLWKLETTVQQNHFYILLSYQFRTQEVRIKWELWCCSMHDNKPSPSPPSLWSAVRGSVGLDMAWQLYKAPGFQAHRICLLWILVLLRTSRKRIIFLCN